MCTEKSPHKLFLFQATQTIHQLRVDQRADLYKQSLQQGKDSQAPEEVARIQIDSAAVSDKQGARGRPRDIKKAQRLP